MEDSLRELALFGVPGEDIGARTDAGMVIAWDHEGSGDFISVHQNSPGVPGVAESGDLFGAAIADPNHGSSLVVGSPGEGFNTAAGHQASAGMVYLLELTE